MIIRRIINFIKRYTSLPSRINLIQEALGRIEQRQIAKVSNFRAAEFRVFSQWGEDGIIQKLQEHVERRRKYDFKNILDIPAKQETIDVTDLI